MTGAVNRADVGGASTLASPVVRPGRLWADGRFYLERVLRQSRLAYSVLARDERDARSVVLEVPHERVLQLPGFPERFEAEVRHLVDREEPGRPSVLEVAAEGAIPYAVSEHPPGPSLRERMAASGGRLPPSQLVEPLEAVAEALDRLHASGRLHRDLRPDAVLFDQRGRARLSDASVAGALAANSAGAADGASASAGEPDAVAEFSFGTLAYAAPECLDGHCAPASDQYALALVVYEALAGRLPHEGDTPEVLCEAKRARPPHPLGELAPDVPSAAARVVMRALSRDPAHRFPSCGEFAKVFVRGLGSVGVADDARPERRRRLPFVAAIAALVALLVVLALR